MSALPNACVWGGGGGTGFSEGIRIPLMENLGRSRSMLGAAAYSSARELKALRGWNGFGFRSSPGPSKALSQSVFVILGTETITGSIRTMACVEAAVLPEAAGAFGLQ